jgi:hypothetical protein
MCVRVNNWRYGGPLSWSDEFEDPISGFRTLHDAANYIQKLPEAQQQLPFWQAAVEALIMAAEGRSPLLHARVGMLKAMDRGKKPVFSSDRKRKLDGMNERGRRLRRPHAFQRLKQLTRPPMLR